jgi:hypothetical protein
MPHPVIDAAARYRRQVSAGEQASADRLVRAYGRAYTRLGNSIAALEEHIANLPTTPHRSEIMRLAAMRSLRDQTIDEINRFAVYADAEIANSASDMIALGLRHSQGYVAAYSPKLVARFDMLPVESVETMLGFLADDSPLRDALVNRLGQAVAGRMADALVDGIATGMGPRAVAALARRELGVGLTWALNTARTAQLWSYREASRANYAANRDIVAGWIWYAEIGSPRTCMSCIAKHGSRHTVDETLNDHHSGRCTMIPDVPLARRLGIQGPEIEAGEAWFNRQPEAEQRKRMGPGMHNAWKAGAVRFEQLSHPHEDAVYGTMQREPSLVELLGQEAEGFYVR